MMDDAPLTLVSGNRVTASWTQGVLIDLNLYVYFFGHKDLIIDIVRSKPTVTINVIVEE